MHPEKDLRRSRMRDPSHDTQGHLMAWGIALVFLGLIAAPTVLSKHAAGRGPGIVDVGTPGVNVTAVPPDAAVAAEDTPLAEWADQQAHNRATRPDRNEAAAPPVPGRPAM